MGVHYQRVDSLPPLAWLANRISDGWYIRHGRHVETCADFFIEGAWSGRFGEGGFADCDAIFGSGAEFDATGATFVPSSATTDYLYHTGDADRFTVANSLALLLARIDDGLLDRCPEYVEINRSIRDGIRAYRTRIPTRKGAVYRLIWHNLRVDDDGVTCREKPLPPAFADFEAYRDYLSGRIGALLANARDPQRHTPMRIFSTQSRGYDTTLVNALAARHGVDRVFTVRESKEVGEFHRHRQCSTPSDDGSAICDHLGLPCEPISRLAYRDGLPDEHHYWGCIDNNSDLNLHAMQAHLDGPTLLLTGNLGEIWYTRDCTGEHRMHFVDDDLKRWDQAGHGLAETRLEAGFVQAAIPFLGARRRTRIAAITESAEMDPWRLNNAYDRPIPRRVGEEAGIPRTAFGQVKLASIVHLPTPNLPVTRTLRAEYLRHLRRRRILSPVLFPLLALMQRFNGWVYWKNPTRHFDDWKGHRAIYYLGRLWTRLGGGKPRIDMRLGWLDACLYAYCVNRTRDEYRVKLTVATDDRADQTDTPVAHGPANGEATTWR